MRCPNLLHRKITVLLWLFCYGSPPSNHSPVLGSQDLNCFFCPTWQCPCCHPGEEWWFQYGFPSIVSCVEHLGHSCDTNLGGRGNLRTWCLAGGSWGHVLWRLCLVPTPSLTLWFLSPPLHTWDCDIFLCIRSGSKKPSTANWILGSRCGRDFVSVEKSALSSEFLCIFSSLFWN